MGFTYEGKVIRIDFEGSNDVYVCLYVDESLVQCKGGKCYLCLIDDNANTTVIELEKYTDGYLLKLKLNHNHAHINNILSLLRDSKRVSVSFGSVYKKSSIKIYI